MNREVESFEGELRALREETAKLRNFIQKMKKKWPILFDRP